MGGFYGSVQVRTTDRNAVKAAAERVATARKIRCLIGPELSGWVGIYPENSGQDHSVAEDIAKAINADVLHLMVHDDDVLAYWLWRDHELVDSYWSKPGCLGDANLAEEESWTGDPEMFRPIIGDKAAQMTKVLDREAEYTFEGERLAKMAKLLGISNAVTEYDYLVSDEREGIKGWRKFEKIPPDPVVPKASTPKAKSKAIRKKLHKSGLLIYSHEWKESPYLPKGFPMGGGFVLGWVNPWQEAAELVELLPPQYVAQRLPFDRNKFAAHVEGDLAVVGTRESLRIMDKSASLWKLIAEVPQIDQVGFSAISSSGEFIAHSNALKIIIRKVPSGERVWEFKRGSGRMAFHPTERWIVVSNSCLGLICLDDGRIVDLYVGGNKTFVVGNIRVIEQSGCVGFSRDGRFFWCGTNVGLRIYEWESLSGGSRKARWLLRLHDKLPSWVDHQVTAIAEEHDGTGIVFGTFAGKLGRFSLETGELYKLADLPGGGEVETLLFSADGTMLAVGSDKETRKGPRSMPNHARAWEIWDYKKLRSTEVLRGRAEIKVPATPTEDPPEDLSRLRRASAKVDRSRPIHRRPIN